MWRASGFVRASVLAQKLKSRANVFPTYIVDKTTQLYGSIETIQKKFRQLELVPSYLFDTTMAQIQHAKDRFRLFSVHTPNEVSNALQGIDHVFITSAAAKGKGKEKREEGMKALMGLILNTRDLKFPPAAGRFPDHMERVTTSAIKTLQLLTDQGCAHYGHTYMIARMSAFNSKYLGGPGTSIALGIGKLIVDNDAEGFFLSPCPMFSDCIYFRASETFHQKPGLLVRFVGDGYLLTNLFRAASLEGTHHDLPHGSQQVPLPAPAKKPRSFSVRRQVGALREEALLKEQKREDSSRVLGGKTVSGRPRLRPLPPPPRPPPRAKPQYARMKKVSLFLSPIRSGRRGRPRGATFKAKQVKVSVPFSPVVTLEFLKHDNPDGEVIGPDEPRPEEWITEQEKVSDQLKKGEKGEKGEEEGVELDPLHLHEQERIEGMDELDEIEEFNEEHGKWVDLEDLGEIVEDLEEFERSERKKSLLPTNAPLPVPSDDPYGDASQSGYMVHLGRRRKKYEKKHLPSKKATKSTVKSTATSTKKEQIPPPPPPPPPPREIYPIIPLAPPPLDLPPDQLKAIRVGYYDARSEKVLPHISHLLSAVMSTVANDLNVKKIENNTLQPSIQKAKAVWATQPFSPTISPSSFSSPSSPITLAAKAIEDFFGDYDVIITPACPVFPPLVTAGYPKKDALLEMNCLYYPFRLAGCPQLHIPVVRSPYNGMPVSLQVVGRPLPFLAGQERQEGHKRRESDGQRDTMVLQVGQAIERLCGPQYPSPMHLINDDDGGGGAVVNVL